MPFNSSTIEADYHGGEGVESGQAQPSRGVEIALCGHHPLTPTSERTHLRPQVGLRGCQIGMISSREALLVPSSIPYSLGIVTWE